MFSAVSCRELLGESVVAGQGKLPFAMPVSHYWNTSLSSGHSASSAFLLMLPVTADDGSSIWVPAAHVRDQDGAPDPALGHCIHLESKVANRRSLSLLVFFLSR